MTKKTKDKPEKWIEKIERIVKQPKLDRDSYDKDWERYTREEIILNELLPYVRKLIGQKQAEVKDLVFDTIIDIKMGRDEDLAYLDLALKRLRDYLKELKK